MFGADEENTRAADAEPEQKLRSANEEWTRALSQRDKAALHRIMADEFELAYPFESDDKDQFIAAVVDGDIRVESLEAHSATVRVSGETGLVFGSETANWYFRDRNLSGAYRFIRVYTKQDGEWRIVMLHLCALHR